MNTRGEAKTWQFGPTAVTLLVAYLLVLQGITVGVASGSRAAGGLFANAICFSKAGDPLQDGAPAAPARQSRHGDICCVFHMAGGGPAPASPFIGEPPPALSHVELKLAFDSARAPNDAATPPLGSRAPPAIA